MTPTDGDDTCLLRANSLVAYWDDGRFLVENYLAGSRVALTPALLQFVDTNAGPTSRSALRVALGPIDRDGALVDALIDHHIYVADGSHHAARDARLDELWAWGQPARWFHFATRDTPFEADIGRQQQWLTDLAARYPPPSPFRDRDGPQVALAPPGDLDATGLGEALARRRTVRQWSRTRLAAADLSTLLWWTWGTQRFVAESPIGPYQLKTSPSGGARHSIEVYPVTLQVDGIEPGIYHYAPAQHRLTLLRAARPDQLAAEAVAWFADQPWVANCAAAFLMTSVVERSMWKYRHPHAYRVVMLDAGHLGQTFHLVATALGLGPFTSSGLHDSVIESALAIDGIAEIPVYAAAVGHRTGPHAP